MFQNIVSFFEMDNVVYGSFVVKAHSIVDIFYFSDLLDLINLYG